MQEIELPYDDTHNKKDYDHDNLKIETIGGNVCYGLFYENYIKENKPCVIENISKSWNCQISWICQDTINYSYFKNKYGDLEAPVADCDNINYNSQCKIEMKVRDYMDYLENKRRDKLLYLKDWHLKRSTMNDMFYEVPTIFGSDWLNEFAVDHNEDDYRFVYIGPENSWTPLHADVYSSYSWSVNIIGQKKWILFQPGEEEKIKDRLGNLPLLFEPEKYVDVKYYEIIQKKGDGIFVPSGWYHQVFNLMDTISINHNWINACNVELVWKALNSCLLSVEKEIQEFKDSPEFFSQCQLILKSLFGMDFLYFIRFICYMSSKRLEQVSNINDAKFYLFALGYKHIRFDLHILLQIITKIVNHHLITQNYFQQDVVNNLVHLENKINEVLKNPVTISAK